MGEQFDLFAAVRAPPVLPEAPRSPPVDPAELTDAALIAALAEAGIATASGLAEEAGRRRLASAVPGLDRLCRRLVGFGADRPVPEQSAALGALAAIGGAAARKAVADILAGRIVQGPGLAVGLAAAAVLAAPLPAPLLAEFLGHPGAAVRAAACRCARPAAALLPPLLSLVDDPDPGVATAAACALGRFGCGEVRPLLLALLRRAPAPDVIEALAAVADRETIVLLARTARERPDLAPCVLDALDRIEDPQAVRAAASLRQP